MNVRELPKLTVFCVPADLDDFVYTVEDNGIIGDDGRVTTLPIDPSEFDGADIKIVGKVNE